MADVNISIFTNKVYKQGASTVVPGFIEGEEPTPINPSGSGGASEFVPYVGATENFDLGEFGLSAGFLKLDTTPTNTPTDQGTMYWDEDDNTVDIILNGYIMKVGEDLFYPVKNQTGSSIPKGTNVGFAGTLGSSGRLLITPYLANGANPTSRYMGVTAETIGPDEDGKVLWFGRIRGINTNAFNEGDILYASTSSAGAFQTTLPVAPNNIVEVAAVINKSSTNGVIFVRPTFGSNITKDEGVKITTPATGDLLQFQSGGLWENKSLSAIGLVTIANAQTITGLKTFNVNYPSIQLYSTAANQSAGILLRTNNGTGNFGSFLTYGTSAGFGLNSNTGFGSSNSIIIYGNAANPTGGTTTIVLRPGGFEESCNVAIFRDASFDLLDGKNMVFGTTNGTKIGTATSQKIGFWNATPIVQPSGDILTALQNLGLVASPTIPASAIPLLIEKTFTEAQSLVSSNGLVKGAIYKISGFYKDKISSDYPLTFYNDGNDLGTTIYLTALTGNTFSREGWGEFYNPIYRPSSEYDNVDGTGLYGIWDGDNPDAGEIPEYVEDQVVFWGGYAWKNLTGNVGTADDVLNLDSTNWEKLPYSNTTYYQKVIDYIEADFTEDVVLRRVDRLNNVDVFFSLTFEDNEGFNFHPISVMCWGNSNSIRGRLTDIKVEKSYVEFINFKGDENYNNSIKNWSFIKENYFGKNSRIYSNTLDQNSEIYSNTVTGSYILYNTLDKGSEIYSNTVTGSYIQYNTLDQNSEIYSNTVTGSYILYNTLDQYSKIYSNTVTGSYIHYNTLDQYSEIYSNTLDQYSEIYSNTLASSYINSNTLTNSSINSNTLDQESSIYSNTETVSNIYFNTLDQASGIISNTLASSYINSNTLTNSKFDFSTSGTLTSITISKIDSKDSYITDDISSATIILGNYSKQIFEREDGTPRLGYYNNSDVFTVVDIDA
jgi:hypothetical protein